MEITTLKNTSRKPYIYKVTNFVTDQYYIGSQCSGKTVGVNYFTSSHNKEFRDDFKNYREEKYKIEIIKEFEDPKECARAENYIIRNHMILKDGLCLNRSYHCSGEKVFSAVGTHHSEEVRKRISEGNKGIRPTEETRKKMSEAHKGIHHSDEARKKMSEAQKNRIKISIEGNTFNSLTEASQYYKVCKSAIRYWIKTKKHNTKKTQRI